MQRHRRTLKDLNVAGKRVLLRVDFNLPLEEQGLSAANSNDHRLKSVLPTIQYLESMGSKIILCSHLGRPEGKAVKELSIKPIANRLARLLNSSVRALDDCIGPVVEETISNMLPKEIILLENLRFYPGEMENDPEFSKALASLADVYILDAFGVAHRTHASVVGVGNYLPSAAGILMETEIEMLGKALDNPERPLLALLGGAKVSDKLLVLKNLLSKVDTLLIGGGMAANFIKACGLPVGYSKVEHEHQDFAKTVLQRTREEGIHIHLPEDVVITKDLNGKLEDSKIVNIDAIPFDHYVADIGPKTIIRYVQHMVTPRTVIWSGPMGVFEIEKFAYGTNRIAQALAESDGVTIIGGGSTAHAIENMGFGDRFSHVSTGGGAMLDFLGGKELPGIMGLPEKT